MTRLLRRREGDRPDPDAMTLSQHLGELRQRLVICLGCFVAAAIATYILYPRLLHLLREPLCRAVGAKSCQLHVFSPLEGFATRLNVVGYGGFVLSLPVILFQLWRFVTPGLRANERRYALPFVFASLLLFCFGAYVAWLTLPHALGFLNAAGGNVTPLLQVSRYLDLVMALFLIFGLTFQFPVVLVGLEIAGAVTPAQLSHWRRIAIIAIVIIAGVVTPSSDPFSMLALAVPMLVFYESSILIGRVLKR